MALLVSACGFTEPHRKIIVIKETCDIDGSFLISSLIGQRLRVPNSGIVLMCCQQTLKYYDNCGKRLGYNLTMSMSKKCLYVVEPFKDLEKISLNFLERLCDEINEKVNTLKNDGKKNITLIIDDLASFISLGKTEKDLIKFAQKIKNISPSDISIAFKISLSDFYNHLTANVEDLADVNLTLECLKSGKFWDVDGKLTIMRMNQEGEIENERTLLYFIADHNVKLSAPGEFGLKV